MIPAPLRVVGSLLLAALVAACGEAGPDGADATPSAPPRGPIREGASPPSDLILITIDTLRADAVGFMDETRDTTPFLDRLATEGRVYETARAHAVLTLPSHASILTGRLPHEHGIRSNTGFVLPEEIPTLATILRNEGYSTAAFVAAFPLDARFGLDRGFDLYDDRYPPRSDPSGFALAERRGDEVVEAARSWWKTHEGERRFLWLHLFDPHAPYAPEPRFLEAGDDPYLGEVAAVDAYLEPFLEPILEGKPEEAPLLVFTSDHGEGLGDHGEATHGLFAYESTLHVPLFLWHPSLNPARSEDPVHHVDLLPTVLAALHVDSGIDLPGRDLLTPDLRSEPTYFEALDAALTRGWAPLRGVVVGDEKAIVLPIPELYDLSEDPEETENLAEERPSRYRKLAALLPEESRWPPPRRSATPEEAERLASLGYLAGSAPVKESYKPADDPKRLVAVDQEIHRFIDLYQRGRLGEAENLVRALLDRQPELGVAYYYYSQILLEQDRPEEALEVLQASVDRGVATDAARRQLGLLLARSGRAERAVRLLRPLAADGDPATLNALGIALADAGRSQEARSTLLRIFDRDPSNAEAHRNLALVAVRTGAWDDAARHAREALEIAPRDTGALNYLGIALYNQERKDEAVNAWERAAAIDPDDWDLLYNLGVVAGEIGRVETARNALERFAAGAPRSRYREDLARVRGLLAQLPPE
ncbi:MAG: sulfatase-like hydrolase/transferase [Thermoanaerobaculia bacterium]|nr:sulfatase-like hydrolase/transferase [Thermoanaerobaculia bacterium]